MEGLKKNSAEISCATNAKSGYLHILQSLYDSLTNGLSNCRKAAKSRDGVRTVRTVPRGAPRLHTSERPARPSRAAAGLEPVRVLRTNAMERRIKVDTNENEIAASAARWWRDDGKTSRPKEAWHGSESPENDLAATASRWWTQTGSSVDANQSSFSRT